MTPYITWGLVTLVGILIGYLTGYAKKKGENLATHEDINKLVDQVRAVTTATKEIEAKISHDLWDRQKRWELRRDALFELMKRLGALKDSLTELISVHQTDLNMNWKDDPNRITNRIKVGQDWLDAASAFDNAILMVGVVCEPELKTSLLQFSLTTRSIAGKAKEWNAETLAAGAGPLGKELATVMDVVRNELDRAEN
jgi:uncharacterized protein (DUF885 family)